MVVLIKKACIETFAILAWQYAGINLLGYSVHGQLIILVVCAQSQHHASKSRGNVNEISQGLMFIEAGDSFWELLYPQEIQLMRYVL